MYWEICFLFQVHSTVVSYARCLREGRGTSGDYCQQSVATAGMLDEPIRFKLWLFNKKSMETISSYQNVFH